MRKNSSSSNSSSSSNINNNSSSNSNSSSNNPTSHTAYWGHRDIAFFVLTKIFPELEHVPVPADC